MEEVGCQHSPAPTNARLLAFGQSRKSMSSDRQPEHSHLRACERQLLLGAQQCAVYKTSVRGCGAPHNNTPMRQRYLQRSFSVQCDQLFTVFTSKYYNNLHTKFTILFNSKYTGTCFQLTFDIRQKGWYGKQKQTWPWSDLTFDT